MKIAIASSDGKNLDSHLGKATCLYIYEIDGDKTTFLEKRETGVDTSKKHSGILVLETAKDCEAIISLKFGFSTKMKADDANIKLVIDEGTVEDVLKRYVDHINFMNKPLNV
ncbi:MAG: dinitrogenase iron-molybdenum cofactor biosynthesis protein [Methanobacteriaceae archaeon]|jgi:predicted Fe-Mo cluster-binding NifX family protein|nr:dinitrogenase iron-molybdenum cofactor biosynthesis protein [Methanobacteriaceae archaeon]